MKKLLVGIVIGVFIPLLAGYAFVKMGGMPVATKGPAMPFEKFIARSSLRAAMKGARDLKAPFTPTDDDLLAGAKVYKADCAVCHGLPGKDGTAISKGLFPEPPALFVKDDMVTDDPIGTVYWKAKNGIRLTGMPGFVDTLKDKELWQVSQLLVGADKLPKSVTDELAAP